jgi:putative SOS response-associated peptidase YedK
MCGLFTITTRFTTLFGRQFELTSSPRYRLFPGEMASIVRGAADDIVCAPARWGFRPGWADKKRAQINARAERVAESPMFKSAFASRRCLIIADGFFEPNRRVAEKQYWWFHRPDDTPFAFAGIWTRFERDDDAYDNFAIITTAPNETVGAVHPRMPAILTEPEQAAWLDASPPEPGALARLLHPADDAMLVARRVPDNLYKLSRGDQRAIG